MTIDPFKKAARIVVAGAEVRNWSAYDVNVSMTDPVDTFSMSMPHDAEAWELLAPDALVQVFVGDVPVVNGFIDESDAPEDSETIEVRGRCRVGRLADESAPGVTFAGAGIREVIEKLASPFFARAVLSNARNRDLVRGKGKKARASGEPIKINTKSSTTISPGQTRWAAITDLLEKAGYLAWSSADGRELVIGKPNYEQEVQYRFFRAAAGSPRAREDTVLGLSVHRSTASRYSRIVCVGSGQGTDANYGARVSSRFGEARNSDARADGAGRDFSVPKRLIIQRQVSSPQQARELAEREMAYRDSQGHTIRVRCAGHGQVIAGSFQTVFAPDTLATVEDERTGTRGTYLITNCNFKTSREGAEETAMELVPKGSVLTP